MKRFRNILSVIFTLALTAAMLCVSAPASAQDVTAVSIVAEDVTVYYESDGQWYGSYDEDGNYVGYTWFEYVMEPNCTVHYSDGSSVTVAFYDLYSLGGLGYPKVVTDQSIDNQWGIGDHTASFKCGDFKGEFTVTVLPSPVVSLVVEDTVVRQYIDGSYNANDRFIYIFDPVLTVAFDDGRVIRGTRSEIAAQSGYHVYWSSGQDNEWDVGDHTATAYFMGVTATFTVTVEDVVTSIEMITPPTDTTLLYGAYVDMRGSIIRVRFSDGTTEDIPMSNLHTNAHYTVETLQKSCQLELTPSRVTQSGQQDITVQFLGETLSFAVEAAPKPTALYLTADDDHSLSLTFEHESGSQTLQITSFTTSGGSYNSGGDVRANGTLYTDDDMFKATLCKDSETDTVWVELGNEFADGGVYAISNTITDTMWFDDNNGLLVRGDYNGDGVADTLDVRTMLRDLSRGGYMDTWYLGDRCDLNQDGEIGTSDARLMLKRVLAK